MLIHGNEISWIYSWSDLNTYSVINYSSIVELVGHFHWTTHMFSVRSSLGFAAVFSSAFVCMWKPISWQTEFMSQL